MPLSFDYVIPVFIVHWNRPLECLNTVQLFLEQDLPLSISIIDNASTPENFKILKQQLPQNVKLMRLEENKGWGGGFNVFLKQWLVDKTSPYCFISAHDALPQGKCLSMMLEGMENHPEVGIISPEYGIPELPQYSPIKGPRLIPTTSRPFGTVEPVAFAHQTLVLFRRKCIEKIGLFDERYFAYGDEYEISLRAWRYNWKAAVVWGAVVVNPGSWTPKPKLSYLLARNTLLLALTYGGYNQAAIRAILMILNTLKISLYPFGHQATFHPIARMTGIRDFILNRYKIPPI